MQRVTGSAGREDHFRDKEDLLRRGNDLLSVREDVLRNEEDLLRPRAYFLWFRENLLRNEPVFLFDRGDPFHCGEDQFRNEETFLWHGEDLFRLKDEFLCCRNDLRCRRKNGRVAAPALSLTMNLGPFRTDRLQSP